MIWCFKYTLLLSWGCPSCVILWQPLNMLLYIMYHTSWINLLSLDVDFDLMPCCFGNMTPFGRDYYVSFCDNGWCNWLLYDFDLKPCWLEIWPPFCCYFDVTFGIMVGWWGLYMNYKKYWCLMFLLFFKPCELHWSIWWI